jgi:sulfonate transport system substrate-binding protein
MKKTNVSILIGLVFFSFATYYFLAVYKGGQKTTKNSNPIIRIGWQIPWATEGQLVQVLKHTSILENNKLSGDFKGFSFGGPLNEAALAGNVDVVLTADQPAATLLSKSHDWVIIGRLMYNRVSLYVPPKSAIQTVADLKGKTVAMPFGAAAQRMAYKAEISAGLDPSKDVKNINLDIYAQSDLVRDQNAAKWGEIDAMAGFDPTPAIFEGKGLIRNLAVGPVVSVIMMSKKYIAANPEAPTKLLGSFLEAYDYYRLNVSQADSWFTAESKLDVTSDALALAASVEPNVSAKNKKDISLDFTAGDYTSIQEASDFLLAQKLIIAPVIMKDYIDLAYLARAKK